MPDIHIIPCEEDGRTFVTVYNNDGEFLFSANDANTAEAIISRDHASLSAAVWIDPRQASKPIIEIRRGIPQPFDTSLEEFIRNDVELDIDPIFGKPLASLLNDFDLSSRTDRRKSLYAAEVTFENVRGGIILSDRTSTIVGAYLGCDLSLDPQWQGRGLGAELVIERCLSSGFNPAAMLDNAAYTPAGYGAHVSAWRRVQSSPVEAQLRLVRQTSQLQLEAA